jgi:rhamnulokinase
MLVGIEVSEPVITEESRVANFTNEVGAAGSIRFLRNVTGFWLLQECVRAWRVAGLRIDLDQLTESAACVRALRFVMDVEEPGFTAPGADMPNRVANACRRTSGVAPEGPAEITRCVLDSVALAIRHSVRDAQQLSGHPVDVVHVVGGGVSNPLFCQLVADACRLPVLAGPAEAASWGNVTSLAQSLGALVGPAAQTRAIHRREVAPVAYSVRGAERLWARADNQVLDTRSATGNRRRCS